MRPQIRRNLKEHCELEMGQDNRHPQDFGDLHGNMNMDGSRDTPRYPQDTSIFFLYKNLCLINFFIFLFIHMGKRVEILRGGAEGGCIQNYT